MRSQGFQFQLRSTSVLALSTQIDRQVQGRHCVLGVLATCFLGVIFFSFFYFVFTFDSTWVQPKCNGQPCTTFWSHFWLQKRRWRWIPACMHQPHNLYKFHCRRYVPDAQAVSQSRRRYVYTEVQERLRFFFFFFLYGVYLSPCSQRDDGRSDAKNQLAGSAR
jgi:hypothetical protein